MPSSRSARKPKPQPQPQPQPPQQRSRGRFSWVVLRRHRSDRGDRSDRNGPVDNRPQQQQQQEQQQRQQEQEEEQEQPTQDRSRNGSVDDRPQRSRSNRGDIVRRTRRSRRPPGPAPGTSTSAPAANNLGEADDDMGPPGDASVRSRLATVARAYGPDANLYTDVLGVSPTATPSQIREAFFCLRYDIYQKLDASNDLVGAAALTSDERREVEARMDAISAGFQVLSDGGRRRAYDASLLPGGQGEGAPPPSSSAPNPAAAATDLDDDDGGGRAQPTTPKLSPSKNDRGQSVRQRRSLFRRRGARDDASPAPAQVPPPASVGKAGRQRSGMNEPRKIVAEPVTGGLNERKARGPAPDDAFDDSFDDACRRAAHGRADSRADSIFGALSSAKTDSVFGDSTIFSGSDASGGKKEPNWANFGDDVGGGRGGAPSGREARDNRALGGGAPTPPSKEGQSLPAGVSDLNAREQMLYRNQMRLSQQRRQAEAQHRGQQQPRQGAGGRLGDRYDDWGARGDKFAALEEPLASPTGVDGLDGDGDGGRWSRQQPRKPSPTTTTNGNTIGGEPEADTTLGYSAGISAISKETGQEGDDNDDGDDEDDDDTATRASSTFDDDTRTYDDATSYADETLTQGTETVDDGTLGESTWASGCDDESSYASTRYGEGVKYSPKHKKGKKPMPILKSGKGSRGSSGKDVAGGRRVTIHSHRGRGDESDDFSLFDGATCPLPSLTAIHDEVTGTYKDFTSALHQVGNAFVISPDDIDRMADKIRDAKIELGENYHKQVKERQKIAGGGDKRGKKGDADSNGKQRSARGKSVEL